LIGVTKRPGESEVNERNFFHMLSESGGNIFQTDRRKDSQSQ